MKPSEIFKVLGVETRVKIIDLMKSSGPLGAKKISEALGISPAAVSQHLKILRQAGLVRSERKGYWIPYEINEDAMEKCRSVLNEVCTCGCGGTGKFREIKFRDSGLSSLMKYERELAKELHAVRGKVSELKNLKKTSRD